MMRPSPVTPSVDFDQDGVQHGFLQLPHSNDLSAWGSIMIPVTVAKNGDGPTALLTGANHGDEYEGPISLFKLSSTLQAGDIQGRVIIIPAMNYPAFQAGSRTSPIDDGNLNRIFPGRPDGTVTEKIADYFQRYLVPMADYVLDMHAGGKTLDFLPFAAVHVLDDKEQQASCEAAMQAFSAPYSMTLFEMDAVGMYDTAVEEMGKVFVSTELGGGGSSTARSARIAERGVRNFLSHAGILKEEPDLTPTIHLDMPDVDCYVVSMNRGLVEFCVDLGESVREGDVIARVYDSERTGGRAFEYPAKRDGILSARHFPGLINVGDVIGVVAVEI